MSIVTRLLVASLLFTGCGQEAAREPPLAAAPSPACDSIAQRSRPALFTVPVDGFPILGSRDALVTVVELTDYECPFCERAEHTMRALREEHGRDLRVAIVEH